jgi:hypothetical protein
MKNPGLQTFVDLGLSKLDLSTRLDLAWNEAAKQLVLKEFSGRYPDLGAFDVKATIGNITRDAFSEDLNVMTAAVLSGVLSAAELTITNQGMVERGLAAEAKKEHKNVDDFRKELIAGTIIAVPKMMNNVPAAKTVASAIAKFIAQPKTLHIAAKSAQGIGVADFVNTKDPVDLLKEVEITASAGE